MRKVFLQAGIILAMLGNQQAIAQTVLKEDFNNGAPSGWSINTTGGATWIHDASLGINGTGAIIVDQSNASSATGSIITTTLLDLTGIANPTLSFKVACIRSNFIAPVLKMQYSISGGAWQPLSSWGEYGTDNIINTSGPCSPKLSNTCSEWATVTYDLSAIANTKDVRFAFEAELSNGGWLLLDDVRIGERNTYTLPYSTAFDEPYFLPEDWQEDNQSVNQFIRWHREPNVGAFGTSNAPCISFDNMNSNADSTYTLNMVWFDLSSATKPTLTFDYAYAMRTGKPSDELSLWYTVGATGTPTKLVTYKDTGLTTTTPTANQFVPNSRDWRVKTVDLTQFAGVKDIRFSLQNKSQNGNVVYIDNIHFYDDATTSIPSNSSIKYVKPYPNPTNDVLYLNNTDITTITLTDMSGRQINKINYTRERNRIALSLGNIPVGNYILTTEAKDGTKQMSNITVLR